MNRAELTRRMLAHQAAALACEKALKGEAARIWNEEGTADTWRMPGTGTVAVSLSHDRATVVDEDAFMGWLQHRYPTEVVEVKTLRVRNPEWLKTVVLPALLPVDPDECASGDATSCMDEDGSIIPGVVWRRGGRFVSASVIPDRDLSRRLRLAAAAYVESGKPMPGISAPPVAAALEGSAVNGEPVLLALTVGPGEEPEHSGPG